MNSWRPFPLLRLVFPFVAGIMAETARAIPVMEGAGLQVLPLILLAIVQIERVALKKYRLRWVSGLMINIFFFVCGYGIAWFHRSANDPGFFGKHPDGLFIALISEPPSTTRSGIRVPLEVRYRRENGKWERTGGKAIGYLKMNNSAPALSYGDHVVLFAGFIVIADNANPHAFNYPRYLKNKGISHRVYAEPHCWKKIDLGTTVMIRKTAFKVRDRLLDILRDNHVEGKEFAVAAALLLGYVDDLDPELRNDYAATGAMHILSVSGMHVGIIYIFLEYMLGFLNRTRPGRFLKAVLLLGLIWFYAMVTGLSPCVLRAAAMLSLPIIGKSMNRSPDMVNIMAASMLFILALDPFLLLDVGFQLSYLAVTGIVVLYRPIYDLYVTSAWLPDKIWSILAVSIAAQVATLPLTLYTFHQFPNYFMLTNVFVVPLSSFIIYTGIFVLVAGTIPVIAALSAKVLVILVWTLNSIIHLIEQLPFSAIRGIYISAPEMMMMYLLIAAVFLFFTARRIYFLYAALVAAIMLNLLFLDAKVHRLRSPRLIIFNVSRQALFMFISQDRAALFYNRISDRGQISGNVSNGPVTVAMDANGIRFLREFWLSAPRPREAIAPSFVPVSSRANFFRFAGCRMAYLNKAIPRGFSGRLDLDILILTGNPRVKIADAVKVFHPGQVIIDATNSRYRTLQWIREAETAGVRCHAVTEHGAFEKEF